MQRGSGGKTGHEASNFDFRYASTAVYSFVCSNLKLIYEFSEQGHLLARCKIEREKILSWAGT